MKHTYVFALNVFVKPGIGKAAVLNAEKVTEMRPIDADTLLKRPIWFCGGWMGDSYAEGYMDALDKVEEVIKSEPTIEMPRWIPCEKELPNENDIFYNGVGIDNERKVSDRVLAIDSDGFIRTGYFIKACNPHKYYGKGIRNGYSSPGTADWEFGEHYMGDPNNWVCGSGLDIIAWMPLPEPYTERKDNE